MPAMRTVQASRPDGPLETVDRPVPEPGLGVVKVDSRFPRGMCATHADLVHADRPAFPETAAA